MFVRAVVFVLACTTFGSEAAFVDSLKKCSVNDEECLKISLADILKRASETGIKELGITAFDPLVLKDQSVSILGLIDLEVIDGKASGVKNCNVDRFAIDLEKGKGINQLTCDLVIEGKYKVDASSPIFADVLGSDSVRGEGNGRVEIVKLVLKLDFPVSVQKRDGEIYLKYDYDHVSYEYEILGGVKFFADNIYIGGKESSKDAIKFMNDNWKLMINTFGKAILEKGLKIAFGVISKFYNFEPAKFYLTDDLSAYTK